MRKTLMVLLVMAILTGCGAAEIYETITDELVSATIPQPREVRFHLAQDPLLPAMESDGGQLYLCGDYDVMVQTMDGGDLKETIYRISGFDPVDLTLIQTASGEIDKYEFVWTCATDVGDQIGRATVLDDGYYHYALSSTVDAKLIQEYQEIWNGIFESFELN